MKKIAIVFLSALNAFLILYAPQPLLPLFVKYFHVSISDSSLTISITILGLVFSSIIIACFADRWGRKQILLLANTLLIIPCGLILISSSFLELLIYRFFQGLFITGVTSTLITYVSEEFSEERRGRVMGLYVSATVAGGLLGRVMAGPLADLFGWKIVFLPITLLTILISICIYFYLPLSVNQTKRSSQSFFIHFQQPAMVGTFFIGFSQFFAFIGFFNYLPFYLSTSPFHLNVTQISYVYLTYIFGIFSAPLTGYISDRIGRRKAMALGHIIGCTGILMTLVPNLMFILLGSSILTFGNFSSQSSATAYVTDIAKQSRGAATALYQCFFYIGGSLAAWLPGILWHQYQWRGVVTLTVICILLALSSNYFLGGKQTWKQVKKANQYS